MSLTSPAKRRKADDVSESESELSDIDETMSTPAADASPSDDVDADAVDDEDSVVDDDDDDELASTASSTTPEEPEDSCVSPEPALPCRGPAPLLHARACSPFC